MDHIVRVIERQASFPISGNIVQVDANVYHGVDKSFNYVNFSNEPFTQFLSSLIENIISVLSDENNIINVKLNARWSSNFFVKIDEPSFEMSKHVRLFSGKEFYCLGYLLFITRNGIPFVENTYDFQRLLVSFFMTVFDKNGSINFCVDRKNKRVAPNDMKSSFLVNIDEIYIAATNLLNKLRNSDDIFEEFVRFLETGPHSKKSAGWADKR